MTELFRARCKQGTLIITDETISTELPGGIRSATLYRSSLTGVESMVGAPSVFGLGGGTNLVFHGQGGERLRADLVKPSVAREIIGALHRP